MTLVKSFDNKYFVVHLLIDASPYFLVNLSLNFLLSLALLF